MDMVRELDDITFTEWFTSLGGSRGSLDRMWDPIAYALGFVDCDHISARCMLTIFMLFAIRTEASVLRMLEGSPQTGLHDPILKYLEDRNVKINLQTGCRDLVHDVDAEGKPTRIKGIKVGPKVRMMSDSWSEATIRTTYHTASCQEIPSACRFAPRLFRLLKYLITFTALVSLLPSSQNEYREFDAVVCALDVPGIKKVLPENFRKFQMFDNIYSLDTVPIATVQVRFNGWVTEMNDDARMMDVSGDQSDGRGGGIDNLLYSADAEFSCFADLAVTSPGEYYKEGEGSLIQAVFDERAYGRSEEQIVKDCIEQLGKLFPSSKKLDCTWSR